MDKNASWHVAPPLSIALYYVSALNTTKLDPTHPVQ